MSIQYPYYLYTQQPQAEAPRNDEGDFVESAPPVWMLVGGCRDEINTKGETVTQVNGENIQISAIIYAPKDTQILPNGSKVVVSKEKLIDAETLNNTDWVKAEMLTGLIRLNDTVKGFNPSRLNARIWV